MGFLKNIGNMPVPSWARIDKHNNVFHKQKLADGWRKFVIGKVISIDNKSGQKMMMPNENMRKYYPDEFEEYYGQSSSSSKLLIAGPYAVSLRLGASSGLYQCLQASVGAHTGNVLMDLALMSFVLQPNTALSIDRFAEAHAHFSLSKLSQSSISNQLSTLHEGHIQAFKQAWLEEYKSKQIHHEVWLSIDGSSTNGKTVGSAFAAQSHAKSLHAANIIEQIWALDVGTGLPVTWFVNDGDLSDDKAFEIVVKLLGDTGIKVKGVLLNKCFATDEILSIVDSYGYDWAVILEPGCSGYDEMFARHSDDIRRVVANRIDTNGLYGIADDVSVFRKAEHKSRVGLFFNSVSADESAEHFSDKVADEIARLTQAIERQESDVEPQNEHYDIISLVRDKHGTPTSVSVDYAQWQACFNAQGYFAIASSLEASAKELYSLYCLRDASEKMISELKTQLAVDSIKGRSDSSVAARTAVAFISAVMGQLFDRHCKKIGVKPGILIDKLCSVVVEDTASGFSVASSAVGSQVSKLFTSVGLTRLDLSDLAHQIGCIRDGQRLSEFRTLNSLVQENVLTASDRHYLAIQVAKEDDSQSKRRPGRPKGSKNKSTIEKELALLRQGISSDAPVEKRKPGRPKGSKSKKTLQREAAAAAAAAADVLTNLEQAESPRKPGRPKGSKNKKTIANEQVMQANESNDTEAIPKRGRGRPKGSLNKKTIDFQQMLAAEFEKENRKPGRPKGSKNKKSSATE